MSIRRKMVFLIVLPLFFVYGSVAIVQTRLETKSALEKTRMLLGETTAHHAAKCETVFRAASETAEGIANFIVAQRPNTMKEITDYIRTVLETQPNIVGSTVAFEPGIFPERPGRFSPYLYREEIRGESETVPSNILYKDLAEEYDYTEWDWYKKPSTFLKPAWSEPYFDESGGEVLMCTYSVPFLYEGKLAGVATVDISLDEIRDIVSRITPDGANYYLFSAQGKIISSPAEPAYEMVESIDSLAGKFHSQTLREVAEMIRENRDGMMVWDNSGAHRREMLIFSPLEESGWSFLARVVENDILRPVYQRRMIAVAIFVVGLVLIVYIICLVAGKITGPLENLAYFAKELSDGNLDAKVRGIHNEDEIGQLARTFDKMVVDLKGSIESRIREESARKVVEGELQVARRIQASLLPHIFPPFPHRKEFDLHALNEPATIMAGDFYDYFFLDKDVLAVVMADVSGKGVPAAMFMAVSRTAIRNFSVPERSVREVVEILNETLVAENEDVMFVTLFFAHYHIETGELVYVNGGHNPPYIVKKDGELVALNPTGPLVAAFAGASFKEKSVFLEQGDLLFAFTDGITEAYEHDPQQLYGEERLEKLLRKIREETVENVCAEIVEQTLRFSHQQRHDDITLLALKRNLESRPKPETETETET